MRRPMRIAFLWSITLLALYYAFRLADWHELKNALFSADPYSLIGTIILTCFSYLFRARRWQHLFAEHTISYINAYKVLILGFFMNNVLPARAGEFVRAHAGSRVSGQTRTLVLATIASERLADGLSLSLMFVLFAAGLGGEKLSTELLVVAGMFGVVAMGVAAVLLARNHIFSALEKARERTKNRYIEYILQRAGVFVEGLKPLFTPGKVPVLVLWSTVIWFVELNAYIFIGQAFGVNMPLSYFVLFLVTVNFSSLIPSAPGAIGVIEAIASAVLVSVGVDRELALAMVVSQHVIQYLVVGVPGAAIMLSWRRGRVAMPTTA